MIGLLTKSAGDEGCHAERRTPETGPELIGGVSDIFKVGVGPSSSHTMGPMSAAAAFAERLKRGGIGRVARLKVFLYGSLALTGKGHATDRAILVGLCGQRPESYDADVADLIVGQAREGGALALANCHQIIFMEQDDLVYLKRERLPFHSNAMRFVAYDHCGEELDTVVCYSIGGGAVADHADAGKRASVFEQPQVPYPFTTAAELLSMARAANLGIADLVLENETATCTRVELDLRLSRIREVMNACIDRGTQVGGRLPGGLNVRRRAPGMLAHLLEREQKNDRDPLEVLDWVNLWALAVNEENAAGGRVVTAPTNGAAGIVPAVLRYYAEFVPGATSRGQDHFLLVASAIGSLFKRNASISGAEVGCQGEVGVACSMAAAGLAAALGATNAQIENAAEIGMEHNLGLTCDPIGGLVQVPCIERNAVGAVKAIEATRLAMMGDGDHRVSLDQVIETMRLTGADMSHRYKETSLGGLAVNVVEC